MSHITNKICSTKPNTEFLLRKYYTFTLSSQNLSKYKSTFDFDFDGSSQSLKVNTVIIITYNTDTSNVGYDKKNYL